MKKVLLSIITLSTLLTSCLKDTTINKDLYSRSNAVNIQYSGLNYFSSSAVVAAGQTAPITPSFTANYANADYTTLNKDLTLTFAVDDAARLAYNASGAGLTYDAMPDSVYSFPTKTAVIKAGTNLATLSVTFDPTKIDPSKSYMLAITLKDAQGQTIASNYSTVYYHIIGNPLAGGYLWSYYRWNNTTDTTTAPNSTVATNVALSVLPIDPTSVFLQEYYIGANFGATTYGTTLQFQGSGTPTNFSTIFDANSLGVLTTNSFSTPTNGPKLVKAILVGNAATGYSGTTFRTYTEFINSAGALRAIIDNYVKK